MYQNNNNNEGYSQSVLSDIHSARRIANQALSDVMSLHQLGDKVDDSQKEEIKANLHHATLQYYIQLKPYLKSSGKLYNQNESTVFETEEGVFLITKLDDFILSSFEQEREKDRVGKETEVESTTLPATIPTHVGAQCVQYLNQQVVDLGFAPEFNKKNNPTSVTQKGD